MQEGQSFKLGVSLTFNNTDFWTNYISYETKFAQQYKATLIGPLVANNNAAQQITDIHTLIQEGAQALIVNPVDLDIVTSGLDQQAGQLSGGNQQKIVVGRALARNPAVMVVITPTVGVD